MASQFRLPTATKTRLNLISRPTAAGSSFDPSAMAGASTSCPRSAAASDLSRRRDVALGSRRMESRSPTSQAGEARQPTSGLSTTAAHRRVVWRSRSSTFGPGSLRYGRPTARFSRLRPLAASGAAAISDWWLINVQSGAATAMSTVAAFERAGPVIEHRPGCMGERRDSLLGDDRRRVESVGDRAVIRWAHGDRLAPSPHGGRGYGRGAVGGAGGERSHGLLCEQGRARECVSPAAVGVAGCRQSRARDRRGGQRPVALRLGRRQARWSSPRTARRMGARGPAIWPVAAIHR